MRHTVVSLCLTTLNCGCGRESTTCGQSQLKTFGDGIDDGERIFFVSSRSTRNCYTMFDGWRVVSFLLQFDDSLRHCYKLITLATIPNCMNKTCLSLRHMYVYVVCNRLEHKNLWSDSAIHILQSVCYQFNTKRKCSPVYFCTSINTAKQVLQLKNHLVTAKRKQKDEGLAA